jgi:hypothetical protein
MSSPFPLGDQQLIRALLAQLATPLPPEERQRNQVLFIVGPTQTATAPLARAIGMVTRFLPGLARWRVRAVGERGLDRAVRGHDKPVVLDCHAARQFLDAVMEADKMRRKGTTI